MENNIRIESILNLNYNYTNRLRGIAIILIMISHLIGNSTRLFTPCGGIGVSIFLFISGFGINESYKKNGLNNYWLKKIIRVFIPYFIIETIIFISTTDYSWNEYFLDITGIRTKLWYIGYLYKQYIIYYIFTKWFYKHRQSFFLISSIVILFLFPNIQAEQAFSYYAGYLASENYRQISNFNYKQIIIYSLVLFSLGIISLAIKQLPIIRFHIDDYIYNIVQCLIKLPIGLSIILAISMINKLKNSIVLTQIGNISYELYLVHMQLFNYINQNLYKAIIIIILSFSLAYIFNKVNNRISLYLKSKLIL